MNIDSLEDMDEIYFLDFTTHIKQFFNREIWYGKWEIEYNGKYYYGTWEIDYGSGMYIDTDLQIDWMDDPTDEQVDELYPKLKKAMLKTLNSSLESNRMNKENAYVMIGNLHVALDDVEILNISEGLFGEDVATFLYEGKQRTSSIYKRP
jgi:hypothetical protein